MDTPSLPGVVQLSLPDALQNVTSPDQVKSGDRRNLNSRLFYWVCVLVASTSVLVLAVLLLSIFAQGRSRLTLDLLRNSHSELNPGQSGMAPAIYGSLAVCFVCAVAALPLGIGTAIFLEEFRPKSRLLGWVRSFIQLNIANLAGVPSIVYGLLGLSVFVYMFNVFGRVQVNESNGLEIAGVVHYYQVLSLASGQTVFIEQEDPAQKTIKVESATKGFDAFGNPIDIEVWAPGTEKPTDPEIACRTVRKGAVGGEYLKRSWYYFRLPFGQSFLSGGLTLALVILPIVIISSQESLRSVAPSLREASAGLGATTWQTTYHVTLPAALPGILTGVILALGRAIGEAAPILVVLGAAVSKDSGPQNLMDGVVTMPVLIFNWAGRQQDEFQELAAAAIVILLVVLLALNSIAVYLRHHMQRD